MIQSKREKPKEETKKSLEETVADQVQEINDLKNVLDDIILNGGTV